MLTFFLTYQGDLRKNILKNNMLKAVVLYVIDDVA